MEHGLIPPSLNYETPNPAIDFAASPFYVNATLSKWDRDGSPRRAGGQLEFGIGGTNAHVILEEAPARDGRPPVDGRAPAAGVRTTPRRRSPRPARGWPSTWLGHPDVRPADVAHTLAVGRAALTAPRVRGGRHGCGRGGRAAGRQAAQRFRGAGRRRRRWRCCSPGRARSTAGMGAELYRHEPVFAAAVDECAAVARERARRRHPGADVRDRRRTRTRELRRDARSPSPRCSRVEYALARLWQSWGVRPGRDDRPLDRRVRRGDPGRGVRAAGRAAAGGGPRPADAVDAGRRDARRPRRRRRSQPLLPDGLSIAAVNGPGTLRGRRARRTLVAAFAAGLARAASTRSGCVPRTRSTRR